MGLEGIGITIISCINNYLHGRIKRQTGDSSYIHFGNEEGLLFISQKQLLFDKETIQDSRFKRFMSI